MPPLVDLLLQRLLRRAPFRRHRQTRSVDIELPLSGFELAKRRAAPWPGQLVLSPIATQWLSNLPRAVVPHALAAQFPRIVNRLAIGWPDAVLADRLLDELLVDRRGGRRGFPVEVALELLRLHAFHERRRGADSAAPDGSHWDRHRSATADR